MKKTIWKRILCAVLVTLTACVLCTGAFAAKYTCIKSGCTREAAKGSAYCWVHKHRLTRAHREKQLKMSCQALHNAPPNRT